MKFKYIKQHNLQQFSWINLSFLRYLRYTNQFCCFVNRLSQSVLLISQHYQILLDHLKAPNQHRLLHQVGCISLKYNIKDLCSHWNSSSQESRYKRHSSTSNVYFKCDQRKKPLLFRVIILKCYRYSICSFCQLTVHHFEILDYQKHRA